MKILTVIPIYYPNDLDALLLLINQLKCYSDVQLVFNDQQIKELGQMFSSVPSCNIGTSGAYNVAIKENLQKYEYLWLWDQDSYADIPVLGSFLTEVEKMASLDRVEIFAFFDRHNLVKRKDDLATIIYHAKSSGTLIKKSAIDKIGLFDEALFLDYVDYEYIRRATHMSIHAVHFDNISLCSHHLGSKYPTLIGDVNAPAPLRLYHQKNGARYIMKLVHFPVHYKIKLLLRILVWVPFSLIFFDRRERLKELWR